MLKLVGELWRRKRERGSQKEEDVGFCHPKIQLKSAGNSSREIEMVGWFFERNKQLWDPSKFKCLKQTDGLNYEDKCWLVGQELLKNHILVLLHSLHLSFTTPFPSSLIDSFTEHILIEKILSVMFCFRSWDSAVDMSEKVSLPMVLLFWWGRQMYQQILAIVVAVQSLSHVRLFAAPWTAAHQASLSFTISQNLLKFMSIESVMLSISKIQFSS